MSNLDKLKSLVMESWGEYRCDSRMKEVWEPVVDAISKVASKAGIKGEPFIEDEGMTIWVDSMAVPVFRGKDLYPHTTNLYPYASGGDIPVNIMVEVNASGTGFKWLLDHPYWNGTKVRRLEREYRSADELIRKFVPMLADGSWAGEVKAVRAASGSGTPMVCNECGAKFKKSIKPGTVEVKCPKCGGYDTEIA
jgi:hypothetical protein